jgi:hypothetical protein
MSIPKPRPRNPYVVDPFDYANYVRALVEEGIPELERHVLVFDVDTSRRSDRKPAITRRQGDRRELAQA